MPCSALISIAYQLRALWQCVQHPVSTGLGAVGAVWAISPGDGCCCVIASYSIWTGHSSCASFVHAFHAYTLPWYRANSKIAEKKDSRCTFELSFCKLMIKRELMECELGFGQYSSTCQHDQRSGI